MNRTEAKDESKCFALSNSEDTWEKIIWVSYYVESFVWFSLDLFKIEEMLPFHIQFHCIRTLSLKSWYSICLWESRLSNPKPVTWINSKVSQLFTSCHYVFYWWSNQHYSSFLNNFLLFVGSLIPLFWTSGDISSGFQSQSEQPYLHLAEAYILHIPWDSPLARHLAGSHSLVHIRHWWRLECGIC